VLLRLLMLFTLVPFVELTLLVWIGRHTDWLVTLALIFVPGLIGAGLARYQGLRCWHAVQGQLAHGQLPTTALLDGLMILVAGILLITPGVLTDLTGLALLIPPVRRIVRSQVTKRLKARVVLFSRSQDSPYWDGEGDQILDVECHSPEDFQR